MKPSQNTLEAVQPSALRRRWLTASAAALGTSVAPRLAFSQSTNTNTDSAQAATAAFEAALNSFTGGKPVQDGRVQLDISPLVENGNTVPVTVRVDSAMTAADHVLRLALFTQRNPQPEVAVFELSRHSGKAQVASRMRLSTSQQVWAVAEAQDGSFWRHRVDVVVTLAACVEGDIGVP